MTGNACSCAPLAFYVKNEVDLQLGVRAEELDPDRRRVRLDDGRSLDYDGLLLATGSRVRRLNIPGSDLPGIHYVRNVADVDSISESVRPGKRLVVVGAGYIGLEVAAVAATKGLEVTVLEAVDRVMARVVCPEVSQFYFDYHTPLRSGHPLRQHDQWLRRQRAGGGGRRCRWSTVPLRPGNRRNRYRTGGGTGFERGACL